MALKKQPAARKSMKKHWFMAGKLLIVFIILYLVGKHFHEILKRLDVETLTVRSGWVVVSAVFYIMGMGVCAFLLARASANLQAAAHNPGNLSCLLHQPSGQVHAGQGLALLLRSVLLRGPRVRMGVAAITGIYEVLATMTSGGLVAAGIFIFEPPQIPTWVGAMS